MNFNSIGSSSNYARAAQYSANDFVKMAKAARSNNPDYGKMVMNAGDRKSALKKSAVNAEASVAIKGIQAAGRIEGEQIVGEATRKRDKSKRKAGALAAAGKMFSGAGALWDEKRKKREVGGEDSYFQTQIEKAKEKAARLREKAENPGTSITGDSTSDTSNDTPGPSSTDTDGSKPISSFQATGKKGKWTVADMTKIAEQAGFTPEQARTMGAIGMAESGGNATIDTSMTIDPGKTNEYSIGLFQVNAQAHGDKLRKLGYTEDDLRDPVKAAQVAKMVYDEVGSFKPWSVYKSGAYQQYLQ